MNEQHTAKRIDRRNVTARRARVERREAEREMRVYPTRRVVTVRIGA